MEGAERAPGTTALLCRGTAGKPPTVVPKRFGALLQSRCSVRRMSTHASWSPPPNQADLELTSGERRVGASKFLGPNGL